MLTMSTVLDRKRQGRLGQDYFAYFASPYGVSRTLLRVIGEFVIERWSAIQQVRRDVRPRIKRDWKYALVRSYATVIQLDLQVAAVTVVGLLAGVCIVGGGGTMLTLSGTSVGLGSALARVALAAGWTLLQIAAVGAVALAVSALTDHPLVVLATVLGGALVFGVLNAIPSLNWLAPVLLTSGWSSLTDLLRDPVPTDGLVHSALVAAGYLVVGLAVAVAATRRRES